MERWRRITRWGLRLGLAFVLAAAAIAVVVHAPPVRRFVLRYVVAEVQRRYGIRIEAARLDYNLVELTVGLAQVRIAAGTDSSAPVPAFFEAEYVRAELSRSAFAGRIAFNEVVVTGGRVHIVRDRDGRTNLPASSAASNTEPAALHIAHLAAPRLIVDVQDAADDLALAIPGLNIDIGSSSGRIALVAPATLSMGKRQTHLAALDGGAAFDGRAWTLSTIQLRADEGSAQLDGSLSLLVREPSFDLHATGTADVERLARWGIESGELPRGAIAFDAHAMGALVTPVADVQISSPRVTWSGGSTSGVDPSGPRLVLTDIAATARVTTTGADLRELHVGIAGGRVTASGMVPFGDAMGNVSASWSGIDAAALTSALAGTLAMRPSATLSGKLEGWGLLARLSDGHADVSLHADAGAIARGLISVSGDAHLSAADSEWHVDGTERVGAAVPIAVALRGRFGSSVGDSTIGGRIDVGEVSVPALVRLLRVTGLAPAPIDVLTGGTMAASVTVGGAVGSPVINAAVTGRDLPGEMSAPRISLTVSGDPIGPSLRFSAVAPVVTLADHPLRDVQATGRLSGNLIQLETLSADQANEGRAEGRLSATGRYDLLSEQYSVTLDATGWNVAPTPDLPLSGRVDASLSGAGSIDQPGGSGSLHVTGAAWSDTPLGDLSADLQLDGQTANVTARAPDFNATLTARTSVTAPYATTADLRADNIDLERVAGGGRLEDVRGGRLADVRGGRLQSAREPAQVPLTGRATIAVHTGGPLQAWRDMVATVDVSAIDAKAGDLPIRLVAPAHLRYEQQRVHVDPLEVDAGATRLSASGDLPAFEPIASGAGVNRSGADLSGPRTETGLALTVDGDIGEAARAVAATGLAQLPIAEGSGPIALRARVTGSIEIPIVTADLDAGPGSVTITGLSTATDLTIHAHLEHDTLDLRDLRASYEGARLDATGAVPVALVTSATSPATTPASLHATVTGITPAVLRGLVDPTTLADLAGGVDVALNVQTPSLDLVGATGDLTLTRLDLRLAGLSVVQRVPTRIVAQNGFARIESWNWAGEGATVAVSGQVRLADRQAAILANADIDLRVLTPFVRSAGLATAGRLTPKLSITGSLDNPRIDGDVALDAGEIRLLDPRVIVNGLTAHAILTRTTANVTALNGVINGGSLTGGGTIAYEPDTGVSGTLSADVRDMALEFPAGLRSELNAMLQLDVASGTGEDTPGGRLSGTVTVLRGSDREPLAVVGGLLAALRARQAAAAVASDTAGDATQFLSRLALDVGVQTDEDIVVDNNYARVQLGADVDVIGTAAAPGMSGRAELREGGQLFIGRNVYRIKPDTASTIDFSNPAAIDPQLNIQVTTRVGGEDIDVTLTGPADAPQVAMSSSPNGYGQADITALLLTGRTLDQLSTADASFIGAQVIGNLSGEVLGFAAHAVGLDTLRLGGVDDTGTLHDPTTLATAVDPTSRLTVGKSLGPQVDLTFSQSLRDSAAQTWIVDYLPVRQVELRVVSGDTDLRSYVFHHDVSFGGGGIAAARAPGRVRRPDVRVSDVTVTGQLAFPEQRIRAVLKLGAHDTFDFARWQADRDRLEDFYHANDHLAARVSASRATDGNVVTLSYAIDAGPRTSIAVSGVDLGRAVTQQLVDAWAASIFDEFLIDEAAHIVEDALAQRGYLTPMVTTRVVAEGDMKTLRIEVQPGNQSTETRIRIQSADEGIAPDLVADLNARVAEQRLVDQVIGNPGAVVRALTSDLRSRGYLRAKVTAGPPLFEGHVATVPIAVDAGPVFTIGTVVFDGRQSVAAEDAANAAAVMTGMPYDPAAIDTARDRLVAFYRRRGFASATVTPRATTRPAEPRVDVTFAIQEGVAQTIGDIVIAGNAGVDPDVITRAMQLTVGAPLEPDELLRARTRVFNTGLFRRVDVTTEGMGRTAGASSEPMRVRVVVDAWPALRLRYGFQATEERPDTNPTGRTVEPGLSADLTRRTLFGRAISLVGAAEYQRRDRVARGIVSTPTILSLPIQSSFVVERQRSEFAESRVEDTSSVSWEEQTRVARRLMLSFAYTYERNHTFATVDIPGFPTFDVQANIARLTGAAAWDSRDDPVDPKRGRLLAASTTYAPHSLGSAFRFAKYTTQAYAFESWRQVVFASAARLGMAWGLGGQELIPSERFFAGGARTVRGVPEDSLGDQDFFGPIGGRALFVLNQEARVPIYKWLGGVGFVDAGNVFATPGGIRLKQLTGSVGGGLRLSTPFGLLRADYGRVVWQPGSLPQSGQWFVGIGQAF